MGICSDDIDPTIIQIDFGMRSNYLIDSLQGIDLMCSEIELIYINYIKEQNQRRKKILHKSIYYKCATLQKKVDNHKLEHRKY